MFDHFLIVKFGPGLAFLLMRFRFLRLAWVLCSSLT